MDAVITAGGIPIQGEPLYSFCQGTYKALLDINGKPMVQWVIDAISQASLVENVVLIGLPSDTKLSFAKPLTVIPNRGPMFNNVRDGIIKVLELNPLTQHVLLVSSDIPAITGEMIDWVIKTSLQSDLDIYYNVIPREVMETRFPTSKRSYTKLMDVEVCGGDMNIIRTMTVTNNDQLWEKLISARKNVLKQASLIGYDTLILLLLKKITLEKAVEVVTKRMKISGKAIICPYAEVGMDIDKPHQLEIIRQFLAERNKV